MKMLILITASLFISACSDKPPLVQDDGKTHSLTVQVQNIDPAKKEVVVALYSPTDPLTGTGFTQQVIQVERSQHQVVFDNLATGEYAVGAYQNVDDDLAFAISSNGIPQEPLGFSNNPRLMGPPSFAMLSFELRQAEQVDVVLINYNE
ncbi:DUF2141 domain-containing protein [Motilimonas pumila]|uniref:DUF2141 domain-containing protein n=1 Tax=Motilimonas pumila TaxID=2303987 RepID=A0A418YKG8_9GAMM|nr:DUF2141 domain-containing protein [Motilimonas pumila]RJG51471.1 DUF2141 domain-containing protein [Motilimonas pumila]